MPSSQPTPEKSPELSAAVERLLADLVACARSAARSQLRSIVLYGSAAENALRPTSDVNLVLVLSSFDPAELDLLREPYRIGQAAVRMRCMFLLEREVGASCLAFAEKFADILRRRRVLYGDDPFAGIVIPREVLVARLGQVLLNDLLRLREAYVSRSLREEQMVRVVAEAAGPLRSAAATLLELEGDPPMPGKTALRHFARSFAPGRYDTVLTQLSEARERRVLPPGAAGPCLLALIELNERLWERASQLDRE